MKRFKRSIGVLLIITALIVMQLPVDTAEAAGSADFLMDGATVVAYRGNDKNVTVPNDVTVIGSSAFEENQTMEKVSFPKSLRSIKPYAFWGCDSLKEISFGNGLKQIGDYAFTSCKGLTELKIPSNISFIGIRSFADCTNLTSITIPETVVYIHESAFDGCTKLVINCPEGSYADKYAREFYRRQALMEEYEDESGDNTAQKDTDSQSNDENQGGAEQNIEDGIEGNVLGTTSVVGNRAVLLLSSKAATVYQGYVTEQEDVSQPVKYRIVNDCIIADQAYYKDDTLQEIIVPDGITEIGELAFARSKAKALYLPNGVEKICYAAFYHCDDLGEVVLADTIRKVEPKSFQYTAWVRNFMQTGAGGQGDFLISGGVLVCYRGEEPEITIPDGVRVIAADCFQGMDSIEKVVFPESLTDIGEGAFEGCTGLSEIVWKNGLLTIGDRAFADCGLSEVTIPGTVQSMGIAAFDKKVNVTLLGKKPERTYESSAQRLSNEKYRFADREDDAKLQGGSVLVLGMTGAKAVLDGADRPYTLVLSLSREAADLQKAQEAIAKNVGKNAGTELYVLHRTFFDESNVPITKLGKSSLTMQMPIPENLSGQEIAVYQYDRNGQLSPVLVRYVSSGDVVSMQVESDQVFDLVLEGTGAVLETEQLEDSDLMVDRTVLQEQTESIKAKAPESKPAGPWTIVKWSAGALLLLLGLFFALSKVK